ncbi:MAG TPA: hypothetical protein VFD33_02995, partial [Bacillota bacterium]|nr:hypothetical protein [Bacillota bacterium]
NMQFELINEVKSNKKIFADSLNKDTTKKKSISMLNVYRKDIYKKEKTEEKIDEGLLAAVTSLVRSKGTRILGNNKFDI